MQVELWEIDRPIPYARNPRNNDGAVDKVAASLKEFGWRQPIVVDQEGVVIVGHTRLKAARRLGMTQVPVHVASGLTEAQVKAYRLADNRVGEEAEWDSDLLNLEIGDLSELGYALALTGFDADELSKIALEAEAVVDGATDPDSAPAPEADLVSVPGDIWELGNHRVMCGSSTDIDLVLELCGGAVVDLVWTDPPYNVAYKSKVGSIMNDDMADGEFRQFLLDAYSAMAAAMKPGAAIYVAHPQGDMAHHFHTTFLSAGLKLQSCLIWRKNILVLGRFDYQCQHEPILYGWKPGAAHRWFGGRAQTTLAPGHGADVFSANEDGSFSFSVGDRIFTVSGSDLQVEELAMSLIDEDKPKDNAVHPTMKPVSLIERHIRNSSETGDVVFDAFGGSGSTLIACERTARRARLMELDPRFVDVIVRRWQEFTGKKATLAGDGRTFDELSAARKKAA